MDEYGRESQAANPWDSGGSFGGSGLYTRRQQRAWVLKAIICVHCVPDATPLQAGTMARLPVP